MANNKRWSDRFTPKRWSDVFNENFGAMLMAAMAACFLVVLSHSLPSTLDGLSYMDAIKDAFGLRIAKLAVFDLHAVCVLYFYGGNSWKVVQLLKTKPISTSLLLVAIFVGSAMMLM